MAIDSKLVLKLRQTTSAGFLDCKKALDESKGDFDKAVQILREKGIAKAIKKADRDAQEGVTYIASQGNSAIAIIINCETDFVAKNDKFITLCHKISEVGLKNSGIKNLTELLNTKLNDLTLEKYILQISSTLGENIILSDAKFYTKTNEETFGIYNHINNKVSAIAIINHGTEEIGKNIAMHISAMHPEFISINQIDAKVVANEKAILLENALQENKTAVKPLPENIITKKVEGRLNKILAEKCLLEQQYVKEPSLTIKSYLAKSNSSIKTIGYISIK